VTLALFGVNLLLIYSHYFGWLVIGMEFLSLLFWNRRQLGPFAIQVVGLVVCFSPWFYAVARSTSQAGGLDGNLNWIPRPSIRSVANLLADFSGSWNSRWSKATGVSLLGLPVFVYAGQLIRRRGIKALLDRDSLFWWLSLVAFGPLIVMFAASQILAQALWVDRYFIFIAVPFLLLVGVAASRLEPNWLRTIIVMSIVAWSVVSSVYGLVTHHVAWTTPQVGSRIPWYDVAQAMSTSELAGEEEVNVYVPVTRSENFTVGFWTMSTSLNYQFAALGEKRFRFVHINKTADLLQVAADQDQFWVGFFALDSPEVEAGLVQLLSNHGYRPESFLRVGQYGNELVLVAVRRQ
jgi:hypothetical protein